MTQTISQAPPAESWSDADRLLELQRSVLEQIARGDGEADILLSLCRLVEQTVPDSLCTMMMLDESSGCLNMTIAPSAPDAACASFSGLTPGPVAASCGTSVYRGEPVFVEDTSVDPLWADYRDLAQRFGIRGCWSVPVFSEAGRPIASFAISHLKPAKPTPFHKRLLETGSHLAGIVMRRSRVDEALKSTAAKLEGLIADVDGIVWEADVEDFTFTYVSARAESMLGYPIQRWLDEPGFWASILHPDDREATVQYCMEASRQGLDHDCDYRMVAQDGRVVWVHDPVRIVRDESGQVTHLRGIIIDITERKEVDASLRESEARQRELAETRRVLLRELDHRVKNNLANLSSLVTLYASSAASVEAFAEAIRGKLLAMNAVHEMIGAASSGQVDMAVLFGELARQMQAGEAAPKRLRLSGPELAVCPRRAGALAMVFQELFTNSLKHGAFRDGTGQVNLTWAPTESGDNQSVGFELVWQESAGPSVQPPVSKGQGLTLIEGFARHELGGAATFDFEEPGFRCSIRSM